MCKIQLLQTFMDQLNSNSDRIKDERVQIFLHQVFGEDSSINFMQTLFQLIAKVND